MIKSTPVRRCSGDDLKGTRSKQAETGRSYHLTRQTTVVTLALSTQYAESTPVTTTITP